MLYVGWTCCLVLKVCRVHVRVHVHDHDVDCVRTCMLHVVGVSMCVAMLSRCVMHMSIVYVYCCVC